MTTIHLLPPAIQKTGRGRKEPDGRPFTSIPHFFRALTTVPPLVRNFDQVWESRVRCGGIAQPLTMWLPTKYTLQTCAM